MEKRILVNRVICPDGTELISRHRHDYVEHTDDQGRYTMVDGGTDYLRRGGEYEEASLYEDAPFEELRKYVCRGGRGKNGNQPLTWVPICEMSDEWLKACIVYNTDKGMAETISTKLYAKELEYRKENGIFIAE